MGSLWLLSIYVQKERKKEPLLEKIPGMTMTSEKDYFHLIQVAVILKRLKLQKNFFRVE